MRRTSGVVFLALLCASALFDAAAALDSAKRLRDRTLQQRYKRSANGVHRHLQTLARTGALSQAKAHALLDHAMAGKLKFEAFEHSYGSGFEAGGTPDAITFKRIDKSGKVVFSNTAEHVLVSNDGVDFSYSEMTGVAGDYWAPKDENKNIICNLAVESIKTPKRQPPGQMKRFTDAFNDMWSNPEYGRNGAVLAKFAASGKNLAPLSTQEKADGWMPYMESQLRAMIAAEKAGVFKGGHFPTSQHGGSEFYEGSAKGAVGNALGILHDVVVAGTRAKEALSAVAEGNGRALAVNDDHFWHCAQDTYYFGHKQAAHLAWSAGAAYRAADPVSASEAYNAAHPTTPIPVPPPHPANAVAVQAAAKDLLKAYAMDGFVSHFLSDQFSSGHLRTPRVELRTACDLVTDGAKEAGLTANVMHDEDNWNCVLVTNARHNVWWACGDHRFFDQENAMNRRMLHDAIAASVGGVSDAFIAGAGGKPDPTDTTTGARFKAEALDYVGTTDGLTKRQAVENTCPLYVPTPLGGVTQRTGAAETFPRPAAAKKFGFGSSLRWNLAATPFPAFVDMTAVHNHELQEADQQFTTRMTQAGLKAEDLTCHEYRPFKTRNPLLPDDCCAVAGRATPQYVTANTQFDDALPDVATKWPMTKQPANTSLRVTYLNKCFVTQKAESAGKAIVSGAKAVGGAVVDGMVAYGQMQAQMGGFPM